MSANPGTCHYPGVDDVLRLHVQPELRDPAMVLSFGGWNDAGESATTAVGYIDDAVRAVPLATLDPDPFYDFTVHRPVLRRSGDESLQVDWPTNVLRFGSLDGTREIVLGSGVEPHLRWRSFCDAYVNLALDLGVRRVVLMGAYLADVVYSQPVVLSGFSSDPEALPEFDVQGSSYEGPTGILGVLADRFRSEGMWVLSLWAGLPHYIEASPNPRGALALVSKVSEALDFRIDLDPLRREAAEYEEKVSRTVSEDSELTEYVRGLKKRDFAQ